MHLLLETTQYERLCSQQKQFMKRYARIRIVHGSYGKPEENWFPWLAHELRKDGHEVLIPAFPTPEEQTLQRWKAVFLRDAGPLNPHTVLVGHSLGPGFILTLLEDSTVPVLGTFLVAGFVGKLGQPEFDSVNESFVCRSFDWERIRSNSGCTKIYNSDNDPYVPLQKGVELAEKLGVPLNIIKNAGHINSESGFREFPPILADIRRLLALKYD